MCYNKVLRPLEEMAHFQTFHSTAMEDADFDAKPMVMLIGQYSTGIVNSPNKMYNKEILPVLRKFQFETWSF